jgi:mono/diheme cytochrome c family protein
MGFYLGRYSGSWTTTAHEVESPMSASVAPVKRVVDGTLVYVGVCQTCHQANGQGVAGQYPPLVSSEWLTRDAETPVRVVLYGLEGPISVRGVGYDNKMPHFFDKLADDEVAAVVTHVRTSWGNAAPPVTEELVASIRAEGGTRPPFTARELTALRGGG